MTSEIEKFTGRASDEITFIDVMILEADLIEEIGATESSESCSALLDMLQRVDDAVTVHLLNLKPRNVLELIKSGIGDFRKAQEKCLKFSLI